MPAPPQGVDFLPLPNPLLLQNDLGNRPGAEFLQITVTDSDAIATSAVRIQRFQAANSGLES